MLNLGATEDECADQALSDRARTCCYPRAADTSFYFSVPGSGAWLLLGFSGPDGPLVPAMAELFDAIAGTLRWAD